MVAEGTLERVPPPITDCTPYENRVPVVIEGKPISEIAIEERR